MEVIDVILRLVIEEENGFLLKAPTEEEVKEAMFSSNLDKAPGPDGLTAFFYQHCWVIIKDDIFQAMLELFKGT